MLEHGLDALFGGEITVQACENLSLERLFGLYENGVNHLILPVREVMIKARSPKPGLVGYPGEGRSLIAESAENFP